MMGRRKLFSPTKPVWWTGVLLSMGVAALFYGATSKTIEHDQRERFRNMVRNAQYTISARIKSYTDVLRGAASLFQTSNELSRAEFHGYVTGLSLPQYFPAIETINFARFVPHAERAAFEAAMASDTELAEDGYPAFQMKPGGVRAQYSVLTFLEPIATGAERFGVDIQAKPHVARSLAEARDTGMLATSGQPVALLRRPNVVGLGMRLPVYRSRMPLRNVDERRAAYIGSVGIGFSVTKLIHGVLDEMPVSKVRLVLYDAGAAQPGRPHSPPAKDVLLYDSSASEDQQRRLAPAAADDSFTTMVPVDFNGRLWKAHFTADKSELYTGFDNYFPWLAMLAGFVSTMLIYVLFHTLSSSRMRAIKMAKAMTKELRDSQAKLQISHQKLRRLAAHADHIKEEERKRIAREIHDDLGQNLLALRIEADILASRTGQAHPKLNARARSTLSQIDATIKSVRQIINDLRPNVLDLGLNAAVEWQIAEFKRRTGIACELVENQADIGLDDHCSTAFFRILQESLSNISRHAKASAVRVELLAGADRLSMTVTDNGIGLHDGGRNKVGSFGLVGIEERINILGGIFSITSSPGAGTTVCVSVPLNPPHHARLDAADMPMIF